MPLLTDPQAATAFVHTVVPALARSGLEVRGITPGRVELRMPLEPNSNHIGTMYAGALFGVVELPGGLIPASVLEVPMAPIVRHIDIRFLRPARTDVVVVAEVDPHTVAEWGRTAQTTGRADFELTVTAQDEDGTVVVESTGHYLLQAL